MFKDGDIVRIKPEYCEGEKDRNSFFVVFNNNPEMGRCSIGLIDAKRNGFPFGHCETVDYDMVEVCNNEK